jgi:hypothetical protein
LFNPTITVRAGYTWSNSLVTKGLLCGKQPYQRYGDNKISSAYRNGSTTLPCTSPGGTRDGTLPKAYFDSAMDNNPPAWQQSVWSERDDKQAYFDNYKPTVVPLSFFDIALDEDFWWVHEHKKLRLPYALDNMYHYSHADIQELLDDGALATLPANVYPDIKFYPLLSDDPYVKDKAVVGYCDARGSFIGWFNGQTIMKGSQYGVGKYGSIIFQLARRFFPGGSVEPSLKQLVQAGNDREHWHTGGVKGDGPRITVPQRCAGASFLPGCPMPWDIGGQFEKFKLDYPHTYLGGNPFICANGSTYEDPCKDGQPTWPIWVPRTYNSTPTNGWDGWLNQLTADKPGRSLPAALIYLGWALHLIQDAATPHHALNWSGPEHDNQDSLGDNVEVLGVLFPGWPQYIYSYFTENADAILGPAARPKSVASICRTAGLDKLGSAIGEIDWHTAFQPFKETLAGSIRDQASVDYSKYVERSVSYMLPYLRRGLEASIRLLLCAPPPKSCKDPGSDPTCVAANGYGDTITQGSVPTGWVDDPTIGPVPNYVVGPVEPKGDSRQICFSGGTYSAYCRFGSIPTLGSTDDFAVFPAGELRLCPHGTVARGLFCENDACSKKYMACGTAPLSLDYTQVKWTEYTDPKARNLPDPKTKGSAATCPSGYAMDGIQARGYQGDSVRVRCVAAQLNTPDPGCSWKRLAYGYISSLDHQWGYMGPYLDGVLCWQYPRGCGMLSIRTNTIVCGAAAAAASAPLSADPAVQTDPVSGSTIQGNLTLLTDLFDPPPSPGPGGSGGAGGSGGEGGAGGVGGSSGTGGSSGVPSCGPDGSQVSCVVATNSLDLRDRGGIVGPVSARTFTLGSMANISGDVKVLGDATLRSGGIIQGNLEFGGTVTPQDASVSLLGNLVQLEQGQIVPLTLPARAVPVDKTALTIPNDATQPLAPGTYGDLMVRARATVTLRAGTYNMASLTIEGPSQIVLDTTAGTIAINVQGSVMIFSDATFPMYKLDRNLVSLYSNGTSLSLQPGVLFPGSILAPRATIAIMPSAKVGGCLAGKDILIDADGLVVAGTAGIACQ